ncbi:hypothetical protein GLOIN_2v1784964 [Rhizophagus clarus]|uniref:Uncharacterized protein n=1 Tax=Rhizophagus clarus TaxID=94130 RepID=A0A8H3QFF3_9GLOM|nr:hypothetical protein GLOIN_2v1784964 [Rhizophagus clarus]
MVRSCNILEFEKLLINCQYLNGLYIIIENNIWFDDGDHTFNWNLLFEALIRSSPIDLFKFKFYFYDALKLESLKLFLDNWKEELKHGELLKSITITGRSLPMYNKLIAEKLRSPGPFPADLPRI